MSRTGVLTKQAGAHASTSVATAGRALGRRRKRLQTKKDWILLFLLSVFAVCFSLPLYVAVVNALKPHEEASITRMWELPRSLSFESFGVALEALLPSLENSVTVALIATAATAVVGALNGYVLSKWKFRGADAVLVFLMFGMFIPFQVVLVPLVRVIEAIGLYGSLIGLALVQTVYGLPLATLIFRNFYAAIPNEMLEAASIDGAGGVRAFLRIVLPLSGPGFVVVSIFQFTNIWNDFLFGLVLVPNPSLQPVTVALNNLSGSQAVEWGVLMAGAVLTAIPTGLVYLILGRFFVSGLMAGSIK